MVPENGMCQLVNYASSSQYKEPPTPEQISCGAVPLDSLPAAWWNWFWNENNKATNCARTYLTSLITEINNVLDAAGVCPQAACMDQLKQSIRLLSRRIATSVEAGAVVSDTGCGNVSVNASTGVMTANGLGNVTNLTTSVKTDVVSAINNVWGNFNACASSWETCMSALQSNKAPNNHANASLTYGGATDVNYGHVKLSNTFDTEVGGASDSIAASQKAVSDMYAHLTQCGIVVLGNTAGCALGTPAAGYCGTAARSDHVHPYANMIAACASAEDLPLHSRVKAEGDNQLNIYPPTGCVEAWINYNGASILNVGNGVGGLGTVKACTFCGNLEGTAATVKQLINQDGITCWGRYFLQDLLYDGAGGLIIFIACAADHTLVRESCYCFSPEITSLWGLRGGQYKHIGFADKRAICINNPYSFPIYYHTYGIGGVCTGSWCGCLEPGQGYTCIGRTGCSALGTCAYAYVQIGSTPRWTEAICAEDFIYLDRPHTISPADCVLGNKQLYCFDYFR